MEALAESRHAVKRCREAMHSFKKRREETHTVSKWCLETALCIACICNYDFSAGYVWLQKKQRRGTPLPLGVSQACVEQILEDNYLSADLDHLMSWVDPTSSPMPRTVLETAIAFARQHKLGGWVSDLNTRCGSVVRTERLIEQYNSIGLPEMNDGMWLPVVRPHTTSNGRMWAVRWRKKHGGLYSALTVREPIALDEIRAKAWYCAHKRNCFFCLIFFF
jgi:hypothetical protein